MGLTQISVRRPLFITMVFLGLAIFGLVSYGTLGVDLFPSVKFPIVSVVTAYPGASPDAVESLVTIPMEDALSGLSDLNYMTSTSVEGISTVKAVFTDKASTDFAAIDVERKVNSILASLPSETTAPTVVKTDLNASAIMNLAISGPQSTAELSQVVDNLIVPRLKTVDGVATVNTAGARSREIQVKVDPDKLRAYGISILQLSSALAQENINIPSGQFDDSTKEFAVRLNALAASPEQLGNIIVGGSSTGTVHLSDVANVQDATIKRTQISRVSGKDGIGVSITKQSSANTISVAEGARKAIKSLEKQLPSGTRIDVITDSSIFTRTAVEGVQVELIQAVLLVGVVLLLFLHAWRSTLIVLLAIPTSLVGTFVMMSLLGLTLNIFSLLGLTLTIGALVDDSIVVLENIFRHLEMGDKPAEAAIEGRSEIGVAAIAITLVDVVIFAPIAILSGITGQFFREFGLVIVTAVLLSLFVSFTLTPMLASRWLRLPNPNSRSPLAIFGRFWERGYDQLLGAYRVILAWTLRHRWPVVGLGIASFVAGIALVALNMIGSEFVPSADQSTFTLSAEMPPGTPLEVTDRALATVEQRLGQWPEVDRTFTSVGVGDGGRTGQSRFGSIEVKLVPITERKKTVDQLATDARKLADEVPSLKLRSSTPSLAGSGGQSIQILIRGDQGEEMAALAKKVQAIVESVPGTRDVRNSNQEGQPEVVVRLDRARAADLGVTATQAASTLRTAVAGSVVTQYRPMSGKAVDVRLQLSDGQMNRTDEIRRLPMLTSKGTTVTLGQVATVEEVNGVPQIDRRDRQRQVTVSADPLGRSQGDVTRDIQKQLKELAVPAGYSVGFGGQAQEQQESFGALFGALALSVILVYMVTVSLYESLLTPFVILLSIPLAAVGALGALFISHSTLNLLSLIGFILLTGLVGKNAILLLDYTINLRRQGLSRDEALLKAGPIRLRPILMTAASLIIAMVPVALGAGDGAELRRPIAIPVIGGMVTSTLLTLVFVPAVYSLFDDGQNFARRLFRRKPKATT